MDEEYMCACTIAGSDSGGGAGIQADLKTFTAIGVWGVTVVTAITAQNTREVVGSWTLPPETVYAQLDAVAVDYPIQAVKTGMLGNADVVDVVAKRMIEGVPLVVDPVMIATSGYVLLEDNAVEAIVKKLIPKAAVVTP
ncbi:MAG: bifunctional hydroxymethylpyrimidine kinase/phosphomethylpyrimidine kinase, partial [Actinobacteria bacterium]